MKVGDMVLYCDPACAEVEPVLVIELVPDTLSGGTIHGAVVMNEHGTHWVRSDSLVEIDDDVRALFRIGMGEACRWLGEATL